MGLLIISQSAKEEIESLDQLDSDWTHAFSAGLTEWGMGGGEGEGEILEGVQRDLTLLASVLMGERFLAVVGQEEMQEQRMMWGCI